jgi:membrane fusion protein, multidrug efflux system
VRYSNFAGALGALFLVVQAACDKPGDAAGATKGGPGAPGAPGGPGGRGGIPPVILGPSDVAEVKAGVIEAGIAINGDLRPIEEIEVRSRVEGDVLAVLVREGDRVGRGQLMVRFENEIQEGLRASATAEREAAMADVVNAQWNADQSAELFKAGAIPERDLRAAQQMLAVAKARLAATEAELRASAKSTEDTRILSPTTGIVATRTVEAGEHVARGATLFTVVRNDILELEASVPARQANDLKVSQLVRFATGGRQLEGKVARIAPTINPANRSITVYLQVPNKDGSIKGNSFATGRIIGRVVNDALVIPSAAVRQSANSTKPFVYRIEGDVVQHQEVELGIVDETTGATQVVEGLSPGDRIIVGNVGALGRGVPVRVVSNERPASGSISRDGAAKGSTAPAAPDTGNRGAKRPDSLTSR